MNELLAEKWQANDKVKLQRALDNIRQPVFSGRTPNPIPH